MDDVKDRLKRFIEPYFRLNRVPANASTAGFARFLQGEVGGELVAAETGEDCLTWAMPPAWEVKEAFLEAPDGDRIADFDKHPLYLKSYSAPFSGTVDLEELRDHLFTDENRPEVILYDVRAQYAFGERTDWGFSLPYSVVSALTPGDYRVHIDVSFKSGKVEVVDKLIPGESEQTVFFAAHTCHPGQVNDGIGCIAVLVELLRWIEALPQRRWSYRGFFGPEYYAAAVVLDRAPGIENLKCGAFLDMPGTGGRLGFSRSHKGDSAFDRAFRQAMREQLGDDFIETPFRGLWGNDEMFYDGPGFEIPTLGIGRDRADYEARHYHTHFDDLENFDFPQADETLAVLKRVVEILETDCVPERLYKGPVYQSRYGLYVDPQKDRKGARALLDLQRAMDAKTSCLDLAERFDVSFDFVRDFVRKAADAGLIREHPRTDVL